MLRSPWIVNVMSLKGLYRYMLHDAALDQSLTIQGNVPTHTTIGIKKQKASLPKMLKDSFQTWLLSWRRSS